MKTTWTTKRTNLYFHELTTRPRSIPIEGSSHLPNRVHEPLNISQHSNSTSNVEPWIQPNVERHQTLKTTYRRTRDLYFQDFRDRLIE
ncbi:hypothetical protein HanPSC8_Chr04g0182561 [Helianthus annuus]|nr:hypothetical protein HanPSC8_Chr04g0182561 [Helianthus annuus]